MTVYERRLVFPEGEEQEISHRLTLNTIVDHNGFPLPLPLPTVRLLAYQVSGIKTVEERGVETTYYRLEQLNADELRAYV